MRVRDGGMTKENQQNKRTKSYEGNNDTVPIFCRNVFSGSGTIGQSLPTVAEREAVVKRQ